MTLNLLENPFHLLEATTRDTREEIAEALDRALSDHPSREADFIRAQQSILAPRKRIEAEIESLIGISPSRSREILSLLRADSPTPGPDILNNIDGVAKANLAAHLCEHLRAARDYGLAALFEAHEDLDSDSIARQINSDRQLSGFPKVTADQTAAVLSRLRSTHAVAALKAVVSHQHPGLAMTEIVERRLDQDATTGPLLDEISEKFDRWATPILTDIKKDIDGAAESLRGEPDQFDQAELIATKLSEWDEFSQPAQLVAESKGLDEQQSMALYRDLRELSLWLANENNRYKAAHKISSALLETFPELPSVVLLSGDDLAKLESLISEAAAVQMLAPLLEVVERVRSSPFGLGEALERSGFGHRSSGPARELYEAFVDAARSSSWTEQAELPWNIVRSFAITLNNDLEMGPAALALLDGLLNCTEPSIPEEIRTVLKNDRKTLRINVASTNMLFTEDYGDTNTALAYAGKMIAVVAVVAVVVVVVVVAFHPLSRGNSFFRAQENEPPSRSRPSSARVVATPPPQTATNSRSEQRPEIGTGRLLSESQVRYCVFQDERLRLIRPGINTASSTEIDWFNALISDYNRRCASFRYNGNTVSSVEAELPQVRSRLQAEASAMLVRQRLR